MNEINIKEFRKKLGLTQLAFAGLLGVNILTVRRWEKGYNKPSPLALEKIKRIEVFRSYLRVKEVHNG